MKAQTKRAIVFTVVGTAFLAMFLQAADGLPWKPLLLAVGGLAAIVSLLLAAIRLQERADDRAAAANLARCRQLEADDSQRELWKARLR